MAGLGALAELDLDHPHLWVARLFGEALGVERAVLGAAAEIAAAQFPDQVAAVLAVVGADAAFAGVVVEAAEPRALVQRADRVGAERAEAHRRDVEHRGRVGLRALRPADADAKAARVAVGGRQQGMADELEAVLVDVGQRAERLVGALVLGPRIDQRTLRARKRQHVAVRLQQVLADLRADAFHQIADVAEDRIVAAHRLARLQQVAEADQAERAGQQRQRPQPLVGGEERQAEQGEQHAAGEEGVTAEQGQVHDGSLPDIGRLEPKPCAAERPAEAPPAAVQPCAAKAAW
ncbi:hypothetical protein D9M68_521800 [compost metagenome]